VHMRKLIEECITQATTARTAPAIVEREDSDAKVTVVPANFSLSSAPAPEVVTPVAAPAHEAVTPAAAPVPTPANLPTPAPAKLPPAAFQSAP
jgi:hypothetical protein